MKFIVGDRATGKTTRLVEWVKGGEQIRAYPYWSRILLVHSEANAAVLRKEPHGLDYRQVYSLDDWLPAHKHAGWYRDLEVGVDNLDLILGRLLNAPFKIECVSATGEIVPPR